LDHYSELLKLGRNSLGSNLVVSVPKSSTDLQLTMKFCVSIWFLVSLATATASSPSNFLHGVTGGATRAPRETTSLLGSSSTDEGEEEEVIYITKRDGRSVPLDGKKVRTTNVIFFSLLVIESCVSNLLTRRRFWNGCKIWPRV
jgi:hypothetical protein